MPPVNTKRSRSSRSTSESCNSDSEQEIPKPQSKTSSWPRFLVICPVKEDQSLAKLSPFAVSKALQGLAGEPKDVKVLRSGNILVECVKKQHSDNLLKSKVFAGIPVRIAPHQSLNYSKGVVRSRELRNTSEGEMLENLKDQNVTNVKRITFTKNGERVVTNTFILTFDVPTIPPSIKAGYMVISVDPFIPNPLRCFKCQRFGHHRDRCTKDSTCARCGRDGHESNSCENSICCFNCKGDHFAYSKECPKWKQEKEIQSIKVLRNVSFQEARKIVETATPAGPDGTSYASKVKATSSTATQTEITWPYNCEVYKRIDASTKASVKKTASTQSNQKLHVTRTNQTPTESKNNSPSPSVQKSVTKSSQVNGKASRKKSESDALLRDAQRDSIQLNNKFSGLEDEESMDDLPSMDPRPKSPKKKKDKKITPLSPPT